METKVLNTTNIYSKLANIQRDLKAPKNQKNSFGGYNYRSCEDILEAVKKLLEQNKLTLIMSDDVVLLGERYYVKATAKIVDIETGDSIENTALAREEKDKKGMDGSQITGASSSYARKYALNGLFCIDDNKDSDKSNTGDDKKGSEDEEEKIDPSKLSKYQATITDEQKAEIKKLGVNVPNVLHNLQLPSLDDLSEQQAQQIINKKKELLKKQQEVK